MCPAFPDASGAPDVPFAPGLRLLTAEAAVDRVIFQRGDQRAAFYQPIKRLLVEGFERRTWMSLPFLPLATSFS
jgi:hypothetical protein